jgi:sigma-E factor negative regulatory protein RseC
MLEEQGVVISADNNSATVQIQRTTSCGHCAAKQGCDSASVANRLGKQYMQVKVANHSHHAVKVGDNVVVGLPEQSLLKGAILVYLVPLFGLFAGAIGGEIVTASASLPHSELLSVLSSLVGFSVGLFAVKRLSLNLLSDTRYQPVILDGKET